MALLLVVGSCTVCRAATPSDHFIEVRILADQDGGRLSPIYRDFAQGGETNDPEYYAPVLDLLARLNPRMVRFDHVLNFFTQVTRTDNGLSADFTKLDRMVDLIIGTGAEPLICLSYVPEGIRRGREIDPPDFAEWEQLVFLAVRHLNVERDLGIRYWEVWNEPNLDGFWAGSREQYLDLYAASCRGALRADPNVRMGGPGLAGFDIPWIEALLDFANTGDLPLDFVSWHEYYAATEDCAAHALRAEELATGRGLTPELILDEWNYHAGLVAENDDHRGAVYAADFVRRMMDTPLDYAPFFEIKDGWTRDAEFWGRWGMFTWRNTPKASYFSFLFHSRLGDRRLPLASSDNDVDGIATGTPRGVTFVIYNRGKERKTAALEVAGLPREATAWSWRRWLVDRWHSNPARGGRESPEEVENHSPIIVVDGRLEREMVLPPASVSLVELREELWPASLSLDLSRRRTDPAHPATARFFLDVGNVGCAPEPLQVTMVEGVTERGESIRFENLVLPHELERGFVVFPFEASIPELPESGDVFFTVRARTGAGEEASASGSIAVPPGLEAWIEPFRTATAPLSDEARLILHIANHIPRAVYVNLEWSCEPNLLVPLAVPGYLEVSAHSETAEEIRFRIPPSAEGESFIVRCRASTAGGHGSQTDVLVTRSALVSRLDRPPVIDGDLDEWQNVAPAATFDRSPAGAADPPRGRMWMSWTSEILLFAIEVKDVEWTPRGGGVGIWEGDSLQLALDPEWDPEPGRGYDDDDLEVGFALREAGPESWCWYRTGTSNPGPFNDAEFAVVRRGEVTTYEIAIPAEGLALPGFAEDTVLGVSILVNDWDGGERWTAEWGGGIAAQKAPWRFRQVRLGK